eukprot:c27222_g1_i5 orf=364-1008(+)
MEYAPYVPLILSGIWLFGIAFCFSTLLPSSLSLHLKAFYLRGKLIHSSSPSIFSVPQSYFLHFYIIGVVVNTVLLFTATFYAYTLMASPYLPCMQFSTLFGQLVHDTSFNTQFAKKSVSTLAKKFHLAWETVFVLLLMEMQVVRRLYESLCVSNFSGLARMHIAAYIFGLMHLYDQKINQKGIMPRGIWYHMETGLIVYRLHITWQRLLCIWVL